MGEYPFERTLVKRCREPRVNEFFQLQLECDDNLMKKKAKIIGVPMDLGAGRLASTWVLRQSE